MPYAYRYALACLIVRNAIADGYHHPKRLHQHLVNTWAHHRMPNAAMRQIVHDAKTA